MFIIMTSQLKIITGIILFGVISYLFFVFDIPYKETVDDFTTCAAANNLVMESYPRQCRDKNGTLFIEEIPETSSTTSLINSI